MFVFETDERKQQQTTTTKTTTGVSKKKCQICFIMQNTKYSRSFHRRENDAS